MNKKILFVGLALLALAFVAMAADATGKWTMEQPGRGGGAPRITTFDLKVDGSKLTGKVTAPGFGRGGDTPPPPTVTDISNGKVDGDKISFEVARDMRGTTVVTKYEFTVSGDQMTGKVTSPGRGGGDPMTADVTVKRATT
jgi:hypothetical protein